MKPGSSNTPERSTFTAYLIDSVECKKRAALALAAGHYGLVYIGSDSKTIQVLKDGKYHNKFKTPSSFVKTIILDRQNHVISGHHDGAVRVWKGSSKEPTRYKLVNMPEIGVMLENLIPGLNSRKGPKGHTCHTDAVSCLCFNEDQRLVYSSSWDGTVKAWQVENWRCVDTINANDGALNSVVAGLNSIVFSGSATGVIKLWRREPQGQDYVHKLVNILLKYDGAVNALGLTPFSTDTVDSNTSPGFLYAGLSNGNLLCWDAVAGCHDDPEILHAHNEAVLCVAVHEKRLVFTGSADCTVKVWRRGEATGGMHVCLSVLTGHQGPGKCLATLFDEEEDKTKYMILYSGGLDRNIKIWRMVDPGDDPIDFF